MLDLEFYVGLKRARATLREPRRAWGDLPSAPTMGNLCRGLADVEEVAGRLLAARSPPARAARIEVVRGVVAALEALCRDGAERGGG